MLGSLGWTWTTVGPVAGSGCCASLQKQEAEGVDGGLRPWPLRCLSQFLSDERRSTA